MMGLGDRLDDVRLLNDQNNTFAKGPATRTRTAFELPQRILWELLDDFVLVSDDDIRRSAVLMIERTRNLESPPEQPR